MRWSLRGVLRILNTPYPHTCPVPSYPIAARPIPPYDLSHSAVDHTIMLLIRLFVTLKADLFTKYFHGCPVISIPGRTFPVEVSDNG